MELKDYMIAILEKHKKDIQDEEYRFAHSGMRLPLKLDYLETRFLLELLENMRGEE